MVGYLIFIVASLGNLLITEVGPMIYVARSGLLLAGAIVFASGLTYISQIAPEHRRTEAIGILGIGGFLGMLMGPLLGDVFLVERTRDNFASLFISQQGERDFAFGFDSRPHTQASQFGYFAPHWCILSYRKATLARSHSSGRLCIWSLHGRAFHFCGKLH